MLEKINYTEIPDSLREAHDLVIEEIMKIMENLPEDGNLSQSIGNLVVDIANGNHPLSANKECNDITVVLIGLGITRYLFPRPDANPLLLFLETLRDRLEAATLQNMDIPKSKMN